SAFHGLARKFVGIYAARGYFGFVVAFGTCRQDVPMMKVVLEILQSVVGEGIGRILLHPSLRKALRENPLESFFQRSPISHFGLRNFACDLAPRGKIYGHALACFPIR